MAKTQKQIDEFFKVKQEQLETLQPRSQMILNDEPLPSSENNYQLTELEHYRKLKSEVIKSIERVWMFDSSGELSADDKLMRQSAIERVFYKIANQWID